MKDISAGNVNLLFTRFLVHDHKNRCSNQAEKDLLAKMHYSTTKRRGWATAFFITGVSSLAMLYLQQCTNEIKYSNIEIKDKLIRN
jgi:hypothetical protein